MRVTVNGTIDIPEEALHYEFVRSLGPGGQHVNKTSSAIQLRLDLKRCPALTEPVKARLRRIAGHRLTKKDELIIQAHRYRSQHRNRQDALERLSQMIRQASGKPKARIATRPSKRVAKRRVEQKKKHAAKKKMRVRPGIGQ